MYQIKEIFLTVQGEGANAGRAAVFCRFAGCNLWSGREADRASAVCRFCDTDFVGTDGVNGGRFSDATALAIAIEAEWQGGPHNRLVVLTGGEPMLQVDNALIDALHARDFEVAIETNGTLAVDQNIDWICVSPKAGADLVQTSGHELKVVYPQADLDLDELSTLKFQHFFLQPMDGPDVLAHTQAAYRLCRTKPEWRLSIQTHKLIGVP